MEYSAYIHATEEARHPMPHTFPRFKEHHCVYRKFDFASYNVSINVKNYSLYTHVNGDRFAHRKQQK